MDRHSDPELKRLMKWLDVRTMKRLLQASGSQYDEVQIGKVSDRDSLSLPRFSLNQVINVSKCHKRKEKEKKCTALFQICLHINLHFFHFPSLL